MGPLREMTVRDLIAELAQVETAIRIARLPAASVPGPLRAPRADGWEDLAVLATREQQIVDELHRRTPLDAV
jgi:hypothetical protein